MIERDSLCNPHRQLSFLRVFQWFARKTLLYCDGREETLDALIRKEGRKRGRNTDGMDGWDIIECLNALALQFAKA